MRKGRPQFTPILFFNTVQPWSASVSNNLANNRYGKGRTPDKSRHQYEGVSFGPVLKKRDQREVGGISYL